MDGWINKLQQVIDRLKSGGQSAGVSPQTTVTPTTHTHNDNNVQHTTPGVSSPTATPAHQDNYPKPAELPVNGKLIRTILNSRFVAQVSDVIFRELYFTSFHRSNLVLSSYNVIELNLIFCDYCAV